MGMEEIKRMALEAANSNEAMNRELVYQGVFPQSSGSAPPSFINLRNSWESFIDSLMREWKTLNIITVLLLSAILTILQIDAAAASPISRYSALMSLICAFMSLLYGCIYIIRFGTMRKTHKAAEWANESERTSTSIFWNVWVMLAMPAVWLGWSMIFFITCIMAFVWQTGTVNDAGAPSQTASEILVPRIIISAVLGLGFLYLILIAITFRNYSDPMEQAWRERLRGWQNEKAAATYSQTYRTPYASSQRRSSRRRSSYRPFSSQPLQMSSQPLGSSQRFFNSSVGQRPFVPPPPVIPQMHSGPYPQVWIDSTPPITPSPWVHPPGRMPPKQSAKGFGKKKKKEKESEEPIDSPLDDGAERSPPRKTHVFSKPPLSWIPEQPGSSSIPLPPPHSLRGSDDGEENPFSPEEQDPAKGSKESVSTYTSIQEGPSAPVALTHARVNFARIAEVEQASLGDSYDMHEILRMKLDGGAEQVSQLVPPELIDQDGVVRLWDDVIGAMTEAWTRVDKPQMEQGTSPQWPSSDPTFLEFFQTLDEWNGSLAQYGVSLIFIEHNRGRLAESQPHEFSLYLGSTDGRPLVIRSEADGGPMHQYWLVDQSGGVTRPLKGVVVRLRAK
ncbi:hypothetical protein MD484_g3730, partial [Candolleomyces efflorescens]